MDSQMMFLCDHEIEYVKSKDYSFIIRHPSSELASDLGEYVIGDLPFNETPDSAYAAVNRFFHSKGQVKEKRKTLMIEPSVLPKQKYVVHNDPEEFMLIWCK